ncbi:hypothetical protein M673_07220 [Aureimonas sp. AU20]|nr:hypothetical protein M673_07220 [Aureimonas sp. AU20]
MSAFAMLCVDRNSAHRESGSRSSDQSTTPKV